MKYNIFRASIAVSMSMLLLRFMGFMREVTLAASYGAGSVSDAFVVAMMIPTVILLLLCNAISTIYIPQYANVEGDKNHFTSNIITVIFVIGLIFSIIFSIFPQALVYLLATKIAHETFVLAVIMVRMVVWSAIPVLLIGVFRAFLQINKVFFVAMSSDALISLAIIIAIIFGKMTGQPAIMGFGAVFGSFASMFALVFFCRRKGLRYRPGINLREKYMSEMLRLILPVLFTTAVHEINQIINKNLASSLMIGTVSALNYGGKINNVVSAMVGMAVATAVFPQMSASVADGDVSEMKNALVNSITNLLPLLMPLTIGILMLCEPITRILFERGAFVAEDTARTAECLRMYALGLIAVNLNILFAKAFYSMKRTKMLAAISFISVGFGIVMNFILIGSLQHKGLALASSFSAWLYFILLAVVLRRKLGHLGFRPFAPEFGKVVFASVLMGGFVWWASRSFPLMTGTYGECIMWTALTVAVAVMIYGLALICLRSEWMWGLLKRIGGNMLRRMGSR